MKFIVGDIVKLKSGGPIMTVDYIVGESSHEKENILYLEGMEKGDVICQWFKDGSIQGKVFKPEVLQKIDFFQS